MLFYIIQYKINIPLKDRTNCTNPRARLLFLSDKTLLIFNKISSEGRQVGPLKAFAVASAAEAAAEAATSVMLGFVSDLHPLAVA